ncbi:Rab guanine nucleotide exchange factor SEC2 [Escovopsis weberi]|uniref:Rab guanine nucleotide exchange factor SEC2 n=1 Tax=Escovopsis weberi TaxID=150374 RepID=A0A0M8N2S6_ESCWE|nr:Rab guanine nucleotide exchange factor SEC2 [Escovopsis weberi]
MVVSSTTTTFLTDRIACCPSCGFDMGPPLEDDPSTRLLESQARIAELETQVCLLTQRLRSTARAPQHPGSGSATGSSVSSSGSSGSSTSSSTSNSIAGGGGAPQQTPRASLFQSGASRISALVYARSSPASSRSGSTSTAASTSTSATSTISTAPPPPPPPPQSSGAAVPAQQALEARDQSKLVEALEREQSLRRAAENRLSATSREVEELSAALFEQANEMVADERRARAKLEERVGELERRDLEKKKRLDRLETAVSRIERARRLLRESDDAYGSSSPEAQAQG